MEAKVITPLTDIVIEPMEPCAAYILEIPMAILWN